MEKIDVMRTKYYNKIEVDVEDAGNLVLYEDIIITQGTNQINLNATEATQLCDILKYAIDTAKTNRNKKDGFIDNMLDKLDNEDLFVGVKKVNLDNLNEEK